jgi:hypothetical protein
LIFCQFALEQYISIDFSLTFPYLIIFRS